MATRRRGPDDPVARYFLVAGDRIGLRWPLFGEALDESFVSKIASFLEVVARFEVAMTATPSYPEVLRAVADFLELMEKQPAVSDRQLAAAFCAAFLRGKVSLDMHVDDYEAMPPEVREALDVQAVGIIRIVRIRCPWSCSEIAEIAPAHHWPAGQWWDPEHVSQAQTRAWSRLAPPKTMDRRSASRPYLLATHLLHVLDDHNPAKSKE